MDTHWKRCKNNISKEMICLKQIIVLKEKNGNFARYVGTGFAHKNTHVYLHLHVLRTRGICWFDTGKSVVYQIFFDGKICTYYIRAPEFPRSISLILPLSRIPVTPLPLLSILSPSRNSKTFTFFFRLIQFTLISHVTLIFTYAHLLDAFEV